MTHKRLACLCGCVGAAAVLGAAFVAGMFGPSRGASSPSAPRPDAVVAAVPVPEVDKPAAVDVPLAQQPSLVMDVVEILEPISVEPPLAAAAPFEECEAIGPCAATGRQALSLFLFGGSLHATKALDIMCHMGVAYLRQRRMPEADEAVRDRPSSLHCGGLGCWAPALDLLCQMGFAHLRQMPRAAVVPGAAEESEQREASVPTQYREVEVPATKRLMPPPVD
jgi:hypothetical protein